MLDKIVALLCLAVLLFMVGCAAHTHQVGAGAQGMQAIEARQWYVLWGLVPLNEVDTHAMASGATDYEITTAHTPLDFVIGAVIGVVSIHSRTVIVEK